MVPVSVAMLGGVELRVGGREIPVTRPRLRALLCALALRVGRVVPFDVLVNQVWGERWPEHPRAGLHTLVNQLRKLIGEDVIRTEPHGYSLDIPADAVDAVRFEELLDGLPDGPLEVVRDRLGEALALWRDTALDHVDREVAPRLIERYLSALEQRVDIDLSLGRHSAVVAELQQLAAQHPLRESLWARLITALYQLGRHAEALDTYENVRDHIANSLGTDPSAELRALHAQVLAADGDMAVDAATPVPRQLPPAIVGFTGRGTDLTALDKLLGAHPADGPPLTIAVHGPGGTGKTTLALHWAHRVSHDFPDGQLYLDMRGYGPGEPVDPAIALDIMLRAIGVPAARVPQSMEERSALWRSTLHRKRVLVLVDNVRDAQQVRPLLPSGGSVALVTSRSELSGLAIKDGARRLNLGELVADEAIALVRAVIADDRADAEPAAVAELVALCGRLPLALVIAAERAALYPDTPIADLVADLRSGHGRLDVLGNPDDPAVDPRAVFSWSYQALNAGTARAFRHLGLHPTPEINLPAASVLLRTDTSSARLLLDRLVSVHLLERHQRGSYRFHDLLQVYAADLVTHDDAPADTRLRILDWYLHTALRARVRAFTQVTLDVPAPADEFVQPLEFSDVAAATAWYLRNRATLLAAVEYAADHGHDRHGWQLAFLLRHFHETQGHIDDGIRAARAALKCARTSGDDTAMTYAAHTMGAALTALREYDSGQQWQRRALEISERIGDHAMTATASVAIGLAQIRSGAVAEALRWLEDGVAAARRASSPVPLAHSLLNLGAVMGLSGNAQEAMAHSKQALELFRDLETPYYQAFTLGNMAEAAWENGLAADALAYADEALDLLGTIEDAVTMPETLVVRGRILLELGRAAEARDTWQRALRLFSRNGNPRADAVAELLTTVPADR